MDSTNSMYMPVVPQGFGGNNGGFGFDGNNGGWWILIMLILFGWGGNYGWNNGGTNSEVQRGFDQSALVNGINNIQSTMANNQAATQMTLQNGFCDNRAGLADLRYAVATEACADRNAIANALRDVLEANNASTQRILDMMCQDKIDAKNERIAELQNQLAMAQLAASQGAQTAQILANNEAQTAALERYLAPTPIPAYVVQNPNCCGNWNTCGCNGSM